MLFLQSPRRAFKAAPSAALQITNTFVRIRTSFTSKPPVGVSFILWYIYCSNRSIDGKRGVAMFQEIRLALRTLINSRNLGFTLASVLMLGLGIAATTAIASILYAVLLAPLPIRDSENVYSLAESKPTEGLELFSVSAMNYLAWTERVRSFSGLTAFTETSINLGVDGRTERLEGASVTPNFWDVLGQPLLAGRSFTDAEDRLTGDAVILGEKLWRQRFNADLGVIGTRVLVDGSPKSVIGIAPQNAGVARRAEVWLPAALRDQPWGRGDRRITVIGRLADGISRAAADAEMRAVASTLATEFPEDNRDWSVTSVPVRDWIVGAPLQARVWTLFVAVLLLLLVACINVANLQIARASTRVREIGVRQALGGTRGRLMRQIIVECLALASLGGVLGIALAAVAIRVGAAQLEQSLPGMGELSLDWPAALVAIALSALTALACGLVPAHLAARSQVASALQSTTRATTEVTRTPLRQGLVVLQFALATLLVVASALLVQQFRAIQASTLGFAPERVLTARITLPDDDNGTHWQENLQNYERLLGELRSLPGVERVGLGSEVPLGQLNTTSMQIAAGANNATEARNSGRLAAWRVVTADFLDALSVPVLRGRSFAASGEPSRSMLLSAGLAAALWPAGEDPVGRSVTLSNGQTYQVVGVVGDVRQRDRAGEITPTMYMSPNWSMLSTMTLALRTRDDPATLINAVRETATRVLPDRPLFDLDSMANIAAQNVAEPRAQTAVISLFGAVSLLLAAIGIAGVTAFLVARRTSELAVRMALGASSGAVVRHVVGRGGVLCVGGIAVGAVLVAILARVAGSLLHAPDVSVAPTVFGVACVLCAVGLLACWIPAHRAARISPSLALRGD